MNKQDAIKSLAHAISTAQFKEENHADNVNVDALVVAVMALAEIQSGNWIHLPNEWCECSVCHDFWTKPEYARDFKFCPNCGADMR